MSDYVKRIREAYAYLKWDKAKLDEEIIKAGDKLKELWNTGKSCSKEWENTISWRLYLTLRRSKLYE